MQRTMPQIVMLNHAAWVNSKRRDEQLENKRKQEAEKAALDEKDPVVWRGKRLSQLNSDEMMAYYGDSWIAT